MDPRPPSFALRVFNCLSIRPPKELWPIRVLRFFVQSGTCISFTSHSKSLVVAVSEEHDQCGLLCRREQASVMHFLPFNPLPSPPIARKETSTILGVSALRDNSRTRDECFIGAKQQHKKCTSYQVVTDKYLQSLTFARCRAQDSLVAL